MRRFQVVVSKDSRKWDSIRDDERRALMRVSDHMRLSDNPGISNTAINVSSMLLYGASVQTVKDLLIERGFEVTVKEL